MLVSTTADIVVSDLERNVKLCLIKCVVDGLSQKELLVKLLREMLTGFISYLFT